MTDIPAPSNLTLSYALQCRLAMALPCTAMAALREVRIGVLYPTPPRQPRTVALCDFNITAFFSDDTDELRTILDIPMK